MMQKFQAKCHSKIICNCHRAVNCLEQNIVVGLSTTTKLPLLHNHLFSFHHPFLLSPLSYLHKGFLFLPLFPNCCPVISLPSDSLHHNVTIPSKQGVSHLSLRFCTIMEKKLLVKQTYPSTSFQQPVYSLLAQLYQTEIKKKII